MAALYTFSDLYNQVLNWLDEAGDQGTTLTNVKNAINQAQQQRLGSENWPFLLWDTAETFPVSTGTRHYALHPEYWRPFYFFNQATKSYLQEVQQRQLAQSGARWNTDQGRTLLYINSGWTAVQTQPASVQAVGIVSSSTSDTGAAKSVVITGIANGALFSETLVPNGTNLVASVGTYTKILRVTLMAPWAGAFTLQAASIPLLTLNPGELGRAYPQIELLSNPTNGDTIEYRFFRQPLKLTLDNDLPDIPPPHSQILVWDTLLLFAGYNTDLKPESIAVWRDIREKMDTDLRENYLEGRTLEAQPRLIRDMEDDWIPGVPRVYSS